MAATAFKPPKYTATHHYIFDKRTGEILATETRWTDDGAESGKETNRELVRGVAEGSGRTERDVDVLVTKRPRRGRLRVDVATRRLVSVRVDDDREVARPAQLGGP